MHSVIITECDQTIVFTNVLMEVEGAELEGRQHKCGSSRVGG